MTGNIITQNLDIIYLYFEEENILFLSLVEKFQVHYEPQTAVL